MAAPNFWYTDVALNQEQNLNFPGYPGVPTMTSQPGSQNNPLFEGPPQIWATYIWSGTEAQYDIINIGKLEAGYVVSPDGHVCSGSTAPAATLTFAIGDNDLGYFPWLPIPNSQVLNSVVGAANPGAILAPLWVAATAYVAGNVVYDAASSPSDMTYTCIASVSGSTAPHSDSTHWTANYLRYSGSIDCHAASGNVAFASGTQLLGGVPSVLPNAVSPGTAQSGFTANQLLNQPYQIQADSWLQALILTISTPVAGAITLFRVPLIASN